MAKQHRRIWEATASVVCLYGMLFTSLLAFRPSTQNTIVLLSFWSFGFVAAVSAQRQLHWQRASLYLVITIYLLIIFGMILARYA